MSARKIAGLCILSSLFIALSIVMNMRSHWWAETHILPWFVAGVVVLVVGALVLIFSDRWR